MYEIKKILCIAATVFLFMFLFTFLSAGYGIYESFSGCRSYKDRPELEEEFSNCGSHVKHPLEEDFKGCHCDGTDEEKEHTH
tara:strand:- start:92 stop:337 length:246 start_codon:yes stop_codon:yes gene_type:complete